MLPQIDNETTDISVNTNMPSKTYRLVISNYEDQDRILGFVDNLEAVKQSIYHILMTERYAYPIYSSNYGVELKQYIGSNYNYIQATIEQTLKDALTYDLRIKDVKVTNLEKDEDRVNVDFTVYSIFGDLNLEVNISV